MRQTQKKTHGVEKMKKLKEFRTFQYHIKKQRAMGMKQFTEARRSSLAYPVEGVAFKFSEFLARKDHV